jgi:UDP-N-acetylmuramyl pentapeptide synthase
MRWADLSSVLREGGLIKPGTGMGAEPAADVVTGVAYDSRTIERGNVYVALKGMHADGALFAHQAIERGALAVVSEQPQPPSVDVPWVVVEDARLALALLADADLVAAAKDDHLISRPQRSSGTAPPTLDLRCNGRSS